MSERQPGPELALVLGSAGMAEVSADMGANGLSVSMWLTGGWARQAAAEGFWVRMAGADVFFETRDLLFNRARFEATRVLQASDPAPRTPDVWLPLPRPPAQGT
jgi:hypothetical protein